ncbi:aldehyde dehydrogenase family protein [Oleomonas cavernae]|uniref:Aldehyde dehydrogenase family protein n=1 Tax=Oleomonas cavernae TaxID=2320859 RepID=A0A418W8V1_9PROT|nr:aldehyde dehydrogenase family protein [Oleomonas cavernae]RJF86354.1 aldehyde dehydrogenase family protein [Oleomonas cavernae]
MTGTLHPLPAVGPARHLIAGAWVTGDTTPAPSFDPATGTVIGHYHPGDVALAEAAIAAARRAFDGTDWASAPRLRASVLNRCAANLTARAEELAALIAHENGKPMLQARREVAAAASEVSYYAGLCRTLAGRVLEPEPGQYSLIAKEAVGVAAVIVPWNAPVTLLFRSLAAALAAGCTAVVKPAAQTSLINAFALECLAGIDGLPPGVVNSVNDGGVAVSECLVASPDVDVVSFTGSSAVGKRIMAAAAPSLKRVSLELGGKTPAIVFADADLDKAADELIRAALVNCGQQCVAASRFLVQRDCFETMADRLAARFAALRIGPGYDAASQVGAVIDRANRDRLEGWLDRAAGEGEILLRGRRLDDRFPGGAFLSPSLVAVRNPASSLVQEELFGPIVSIEPFDDEAGALALAHATRYGLAASVFTRDLARAMRVARRLKTGTVWLNAHGRLIAEAEMEGFGESGIGRLHGADALGEFLQTKHIYLPFGEA